MSGCYCTAPATTGNLCTEHLGKLRMDLWKAPETLRQLDVTITNQAVQGGGGTNSESPMAFNETASDRRQDLIVVLRSAAHIADPQVRHVYAEEPRHLVARALSDVQAVARSPYAHTVTQDLGHAVEAAWRTMNTAEERFTYGRCDCGRMVTAPRSAQFTTCPACGQRWDVLEWKTTKEAEARKRIPEFVGTVKEVLLVLQIAGHAVKRGNVDRWVHEGKLTPHIEGTKQYRVEDVARLASISLTEKVAEDSL